MATSLGTVVKKEKLQASTMSREGEKGEIRLIREHSLVNRNTRVVYAVQLL